MTQDDQADINCQAIFFTRGIDLMIYQTRQGNVLTTAVWWSARSPTKFQAGHSVTAFELISIIALKC